MPEDTRISALDPPPAELAGLKRRHPGWRIDFRLFADGPRYDATSRDEGRPRLVTRTAAGMDEQIAAAEAGTWRP
jgi:hypothetical protein